MARGQTSPMEKILENPGLVHLAENIFSHLNDADVEICQNINQTSKEILDNPMFWLRKFRNLSQKDQKDWIKDIQSIKNSEKKKAIASYLQWKLKKNTGEKPFICEICDKSFTSEKNKKVHVQRHQGSLPHKCDVCSMTFQSRSHLIKHATSHNRQGNSTSF